MDDILYLGTNLQPEYARKEALASCKQLMDILELRNKYIFYDDYNLPHPFIFRQTTNSANFPVHEELASSNVVAEMKNGVISFKINDNPINTNIVSAEEFYQDLTRVIRVSYDDISQSYCYNRLKLLQMKFDMHIMQNTERENIPTRTGPLKDFYNIIKVDNHVHLSACMNQKHLQKFIKAKMNKEADTIVLLKNGREMTLKQVFESLGITSTLTVDMLECHADHVTFQRFDRFNNKYNPMGEASLREIFLKTDNYIGGRYFAEITSEVIKNHEKKKYILAEYRVSIYGRRSNEWDLLSQWFSNHHLNSRCIKWLIQIPRIYKVYKSSRQVKTFQDMIENIFMPVLQATLYPDQYPHIAFFLTQIVGFDTVDDESQMEKVTSYSNYKEIKPESWDVEENPPYSYWSYYIYANLLAINQLRRARGMNTFAYRPHCGEAGSRDHLACAFLTAHSINHGIELANDPVLQYLFYMKQIGLSMSPLSNNKLFLKFLQNPFLKFFKRGLNATLSTDDPLMIHLTREPLLEEYSVAAQVYDLSQIDLCEIARNSVLQSGFSFEEKKRWLGEDFLEGGQMGNDEGKTNVSNIRYYYRYETFREEIEFMTSQSRRNSLLRNE
ncbi:unnamed protein product [Blepharisma stoltei]|uniref:AMP deaminase n=1 Tax=Blepharisma stoltei TaxID=1481888 RepID=A0AAU9JJF3_9CILI|nr:unnamed protein product [Blepharisma stoltei]